MQSDPKVIHTYIHTYFWSYGRAACEAAGKGSNGPAEGKGQAEKIQASGNKPENPQQRREGTERRVREAERRPSTRRRIGAETKLAACTNRV